MLGPLASAVFHSLFLLCRSVSVNGCRNNWVEELEPLIPVERTEPKQKSTLDGDFLKDLHAG